MYNIYTYTYIHTYIYMYIYTHIDTHIICIVMQKYLINDFSKRDHLRPRCAHRGRFGASAEEAWKVCGRFAEAVGKKRFQ